MPILIEPPDDGWPFGRRSEDWTPEERRRVFVWLNTPPQLGQMHRYTAHHLGIGTTPEDAEDAWQAFVATELNRTIDLFDPSRGSFVTFLQLRLRQDCWRAGQRIRRRREERLERQHPDGHAVELDVVDPKAEAEPDLAGRIDEERAGERVRRCLSTMPAAWKVVVLMYYFEEKTTQEIAKELGLSSGNVRIRLLRGRLWLKEHLDLS